MTLDEMLSIIYADIESLIKKCNPEKSSTTKIGKHVPCGYLISTIWVFDLIENNHSLYRGKNCLKKFCESLREHTKNIIDFKKKKCYR